MNVGLWPLHEDFGTADSEYKTLYRVNCVQNKYIHIYYRKVDTYSISLKSHNDPMQNASLIFSDLVNNLQVNAYAK